MCGIAGFSLGPSISIDRSLLVRLCLAGLAERGEDACGYAYRDAAGNVQITKRASAPDVFLRETTVNVPVDASMGIVHVRDHTKGLPSLDGNNHPIRHGAVCGVHNGIIQNDDALFREFGRDRALPGMSVDSEAIFMTIDVLGSVPLACKKLVGSYCMALFDDRAPNELSVARGRARPLFIACANGVVIFASTRHALEFVLSRCGLELTIDAVEPETQLVLCNGRISDRKHLDVQRFSEPATVSYQLDATRAQNARELLEGELRRTVAQ